MSARLTFHRCLFVTAAAAALAGSLVAGPADARRGGSFGSRGARTYYAPRATNLAPGYVPPVARSMTDRSAAAAAPRYAPSSYGQPGFSQPRRGLFGGFGGGLLTGIVAGGLIGHFLGHGYGGYGGGGGGMLAVLIQLALIGGAIWLLFRLFAGRGSSPAYRADAGYRPDPAYQASPTMAPDLRAPAQGDDPTRDDLTLSAADQDAFERLLVALQEAFGREDYAGLRAITTPEVMSYLAEELGDNASHGRRNEVTGTRLLDGEVSEAWREDDRDYATVALRYESVDLMRDRATGAIVAGTPGRPTTTTELWTFVRRAGSGEGWKVSAIQES